MRFWKAIVGYFTRKAKRITGVSTPLGGVTFEPELPKESVIQKATAEEIEHVSNATRAYEKEREAKAELWAKIGRFSVGCLLLMFTLTAVSVAVLLVSQWGLPMLPGGSLVFATLTLLLLSLGAVAYHLHLLFDDDAAPWMPMLIALAVTALLWLLSG